MSGMKIGKFDCIPHLSLMFLILFLSFLRPASCANGDDDDDDFQSKNLNGRSLVTALIYTQISNLTKIFRSDITRTLGYCIKNVDADLNGAFKFGSNLDFLDNCVKQTKDLTQRICTAAEMKFYFSGFMDHKSGEAQILKPNRNCNLTYWISGCEPGWASSVPPNVKVDIRNSQIIPQRSHNSQPCCEGFFCPRGLTCMIPCPLGAYCPLAKLNKTTGICDPYLYQLPPGKINHTCGGADVWASVTSSEEIFCSGGYFCPTTTTKVPCSRGHYCRMGFTAEKACMKLNSCNSKTADQNLHAFGFLLIGALTFILFLIYNCSDQVINTRYKRLAKSREAAARSARETAQARERWKSAKNVAKKGIELPRQISRTISRKTSKKQEVLPPKAPNIQSKGVTKVKKKEPGPLTKMVHSLENDSEDFKGFNMEIGDRNIKKQTPKTKQLHTKSQIFKYAYGQLEKEKAMEQKNENLTFSSVISMATDTEVRTRMTIEVAFKDLTLTLKGKNKHLMRSVTGKLSPGRISAVMGPSGAGKTTFLSSVMGKTTGYTVTGSILINGKSDPIQSYKKIVGFVPQDDIVHGNLTVEENLRFSARCRLAEDLPKADKVLVVERVIEALGLQGVRESLVGNVQKRGISGGQRKRVNVGLEMVMEPSLLILDEPTTGLDSSSSNLLLKALRREALEGVNICMVVHQPSYTLFKAFDDLILLAKGGLIVYHGPVKKVEEYFAGIGINVPERVNPPDHLIDILEGFEKPPEGLSVQQLPVRWMLHNGYPVPHDMMPLLDQIGSSSKPVNPSADSSNSSFGGDPWKEKQRSTNYLLNARDLSNRVTPGVLRQYRYYLGRVSKQKLRESDIQAVDYIILLLAGACLGRLSKVKGDTFGYRGYMYTIIAVSLLCKVAALRSFSQDKLEYWRERSSGMSSLAYFLSKDTIDLFNMVVKPLVFLSMFYFLSTPRSTFGDNYVILLCLVYCVNGIAYVFAIVLEPGPAQLWCVLLPVVLTLIATMDPDAKMAKIMGNFCYTKWALEAFVIANAQRYSGVWLITRCGTLLELGFNVNNYARCLVFLLLTGVGFRVLAYLCLVAKR